MHISLLKKWCVRSGCHDYASIIYNIDVMVWRGRYVLFMSDAYNKTWTLKYKVGVECSRAGKYTTLCDQLVYQALWIDIMLVTLFLYTTYGCVHAQMDDCWWLSSSCIMKGTISWYITRIEKWQIASVRELDLVDCINGYRHVNISIAQPRLIISGVSAR